MSSKEDSVMTVEETVTPGEALEYISAFIKLGIKRPIMLWGPPGASKSAIMMQAAENAGMECREIRLPTILPVDLGGVPFPDLENRRAAWLPAGFLPDEKRDGPKGILFLDELSAAPPATQAAAYQLVFNRRVGEYVLPEGWLVMAAGNRVSDRGVAYRMPSPMISRLIHLNVEPSLDDWKNWAYGHGIDFSIISFLNFRPNLLHSMPKAMDDIKAFPTPRTWEFASDIVKAFGDSDATPLLKGTIGTGPATEYMTFKKIEKSLPDIKTVLEKGEFAPIAKDQPAVMFAAIGAFISRLTDYKKNDKLQSKHIDNMFSFLETLPKDFQIKAVVELAKTTLCKDVAVNKYFKAWLPKNTKLMRTN